MRLFNVTELVRKSDLKVGDGATYCVGSDCYPYTIIEIISEKKLVVQADNSKMVGGSYYGEQEYEYTPNPDGGKFTITLRKNGRWIPVGGNSRSDCGFSVGHRRKYRDPHF